MSGGRIVVELDDDGETFGVTVEVSADLNMVEAVGLLEIAKLQHLDGKRVTHAVVHSVEQSPN